MSEWEVPNEFELPGGDLTELGGGKLNLMNFDPPGPIGEAFMYGAEPIDCIMGPAGSGKTVSSIFRCGTITMRIPVCKDGVIRSRIAIIRDNFRTLYRTTLQSWFQFFPKDFPGSTFEGGQDRPFRHTIRFRTPSGQAVQLIADGFGIGNQKIEEVARGYEPSGAWLSEMDLLERRVPSFMFGRVAQNRYPPRGMRADPDAPMPKTVWGDMNPPLISHWAHDDFVENPRNGYVLRRQPSGLSEAAENRRHVSRETYEAMAATMNEDEVRRFVHGEFGLVGDGALVYPEFDYGVHLAKSPLEPLDVPLRVGLDAKGTPAAAIFQHTAKGQLRVLDELVGEPNMSPGRFAEGLLDLLQAKYRGLPVSHAWGDPSGFHGADKVAGELAFLEIISKIINVRIWPTATNNPQMRQESISWFLRRPSPGMPVPYFLLSPVCKMLLGGFQGGFLIRLNRHETSDRIAFVKNRFSHIHEALQYGAYGSRGHADVANDAARAGRPGNVVPIMVARQVRSDFNVFDV